MKPTLLISISLSPVFGLAPPPYPAYSPSVAPYPYLNATAAFPTASRPSSGLSFPTSSPNTTTVNSTIAVTLTHTVIPVPLLSTGLQPGFTSPSRPHSPFPITPANGTTGCTPNTIECTSNTGWSLCAPVSSTRNAYIDMGDVAPGTMCQGGTIVRKTDGACAPDGALICGGDGKSFSLCVDGGLVSSGSVVNGTRCVDGQIEYAGI